MVMVVTVMVIFVDRGIRSDVDVPSLGVVAWRIAERVRVGEYIPTRQERNQQNGPESVQAIISTNFCSLSYALFDFRSKADWAKITQRDVRKSSDWEPVTELQWKCWVNSPLGSSSSRIIRCCLP